MSSVAAFQATWTFVVDPRVPPDLMDTVGAWATGGVVS